MKYLEQLFAFDFIKGLLLNPSAREVIEHIDSTVVSENWIKQKGTYFLDKTNTHLTNIRWVGYFTIYLQNNE